jgi:hypothetical protein
MKTDDSQLQTFEVKLYTNDWSYSQTRCLSLVHKQKKKKKLGN